MTLWCYFWRHNLILWRATAELAGLALMSVGIIWQMVSSLHSQFERKSSFCPTPAPASAVRSQTWHYACCHPQSVAVTSHHPHIVNDVTLGTNHPHGSSTMCLSDLNYSQINCVCVREIGFRGEHGWRYNAKRKFVCFYPVSNRCRSGFWKHNSIPTAIKCHIKVSK